MSALDFTAEYDGLAIALARKFAGRFRWLDLDDCIQEARLGLINAAKYFNPDLQGVAKGFAFASVKNYLRSHLRKDLSEWPVRRVRNVADRRPGETAFGVALEDALEVSDERVRRFTEALELRETLAPLNKKQIVILVLFAAGHSDQEIGKFYDMSHQAVYQQRVTALQRAKCRITTQRCDKKSGLWAGQAKLVTH